MIPLMRKLLDRKENRLFFAGIIVNAANAGGAWPTIGDVTTTMLWIGGQITTLPIIKAVLLPSLANLMVPLAITAILLRGKTVIAAEQIERRQRVETTPMVRNLMFFCGISCLVSVPIFKLLTDLPPFMGVMFGLGLLWLIGDLVHRKKNDHEKKKLTLVHALNHIDMSSILFFFGILLAVAALEHAQILNALAEWLDQTIGSPAGVAAMGMEKIYFFWYVKKISGLALIGYFAGAAVYLLQARLLLG